MKISFNLNGENVSAETLPTERLVTILRNKFSLCLSKMRCGEGNCGACTVLLDGVPVHSCIIPVYAAAGCEIITLEHFLQTEEGKDIEQAFKQANVKTCGFCDADKYFSINEYINKNPAIKNSDEIRAMVENMNCQCVKHQRLGGAIVLAARNRRTRKNGEKHGK